MKKKLFLLVVACISLLAYKNVNAKEFDSIDSSFIPKDVEVTKYIKTEILYDTLTKKILETKETELTEEQYNMLDYISEPLANCSDGAACWETEYKKVSLRVESPVSVLTNGKVILTTTWKKVPSVKSHDIIAITFANSMKGVSASLTSSVASNAGSKVTSEGVGISAKLSNSISANNTIVLTVSGKYSDLSTWLNGKVCGTYQHAQSTVTAADSLAYSFSRGQGGVGSVLNFNSATIRDKYDQMQGVCFN